MSRRLDSWKEIASHFGRQVRTAQRWEREEGMPVHRHLHRRRGTVHAWTDELDAWWQARRLAPLQRLEGDAPAGDGRRGSVVGGAASDLAHDGEPRRPEDAARDPRRAGVAGGGAIRRAGLRGRAATGLLPALAFAASVAAAAILSATFLDAHRGAAGPRQAAAVAAGPAAPSPLAEARYLLHRGSAPELERALALCERGAAESPGRADLAECRGHALLGLTRQGRIPTAEGFSRARDLAREALALEPDRADALAIAGWAGFGLDWRAAEAEALFRRAIARDRAAALAHHGLAHLLSATGRHDEAIAELRSAQRAEPLSAALNDDGCWFFYRARRNEEALAEAERALLLEPGRVGALLCVVDARTAQGEDEAARTAAVAVLRSIGDPAAEGLAGAPAVEAATRLRRRLLARVEERRGREWVPAMPFAMLNAQLGEREAALGWLERALKSRDPVLLLVRVHPAFDPLRGDPRLDDLLRRAGV